MNKYSDDMTYFEEPLVIVLFHVDRPIDGTAFAVEMASVLKNTMMRIPIMNLSGWKHDP